MKGREMKTKTVLCTISEEAYDFLVEEAKGSGATSVEEFCSAILDDYGVIEEDAEPEEEVERGNA